MNGSVSSSRPFSFIALVAKYRDLLEVDGWTFLSDHLVVTLKRVYSNKGDPLERMVPLDPCMSSSRSTIQDHPKVGIRNIAASPQRKDHLEGKLFRSRYFVPWERGGPHQYFPKRGALGVTKRRRILMIARG